MRVDKAKRARGILYKLSSCERYARDLGSGIRAIKFVGNGCEVSYVPGDGIFEVLIDKAMEHERNKVKSIKSELLRL